MKVVKVKTLTKFKIRCSKVCVEAAASFYSIVLVVMGLIVPRSPHPHLRSNPSHHSTCTR